MHYFSIFRALYGNNSTSTNGGAEIRRVLQQHQDNYRTTSATTGYNNNINGISARISSLEKCFSLPCQLSQCSDSKETIRQRPITKNCVTVMEMASNTTTGPRLVRTGIVRFSPSLVNSDVNYKIFLNSFA